MGDSEFYHLRLKNENDEPIKDIISKLQKQYKYIIITGEQFSLRGDAFSSDLEEFIKPLDNEYISGFHFDYFKNMYNLWLERYVLLRCAQFRDNLRFCVLKQSAKIKYEGKNLCEFFNYLNKDDMLIYYIPVIAPLIEG